MQHFTVDFCTKIYTIKNNQDTFQNSEKWLSCGRVSKEKHRIPISHFMFASSLDKFQFKTSKSLSHSLSPCCNISTGFFICQLLLAEGCHVPKAGTEFPVINSHSEYISQLTRKQLAQG